jgi:hypothetical protein
MADWLNGDGTQLPLDPTPQGYNFSAEQLTRELYSGAFRTSWLVQSYESLFSLGVNRFDPFYPSEFISLDDLDPNLIAIAEQACGLQGVRSAAALLRCVLDVANTGDEIFAVLATAGQPQLPGVAISPRALYLSSVTNRELTAFVKGLENDAVIWSTTGGTVSGSGQTASYTPPAEHGTYTTPSPLRWRLIHPSVIRYR